MLKTEFNFYTRLKNESTILLNSIAESIKKSDNFQRLKSSKIIIVDPKIRGAKCKINKLELYNKFYKDTFPNAHITVETEIDNQLKYKSTKATQIEKDRVIFIRGFKDIEVNGKVIDLKNITEDFILFSTVLKSLKSENICFIENLQPFLEAEKIISKEYIYIHFYGRFPKEKILKLIECKQYLHFSDYDFVGMNEYLRAKKVYVDAKFFIPNDYDELFKLYSIPRKKKDTIYKDVKDTNLTDIVKIREEIKENNLFLEQQIVLRSKDV